MNMTERVIFLSAGVILFIAGANGYAEESQIVLATFGVVINPFYMHYKIKHSKSVIDADKPNLLEIRKLQLLKKRLYRLLVAGEFLFLFFLLNLLLKDNFWLLFIGLGFVYFFISITICSFSTCPRCNKFFFKESETSSSTFIGPTSIGMWNTPLYVSFTNSCKHCGVSWNQGT